jgi:secreted trypsin-like serine protease
VKPHSFPFQVAIFLLKDDGQEFFCGGSLISPSFVLTGNS